MTTALSAGHIAEMVIAEEVTPGTSPSISTGLRDYFTGDPGINPVQNVIKVGNVQKRHLVSHVLSDFHMEGTIPQIVTPNGHIGYWLGLAFGDPTSANLAGSAYSHTYNPDDALKTFSMWYKRGGNQQVVIPYCVVNTLELIQSVDDVLRANIGFIGQKETIDASDITSADAYDTIQPFHNINLAVTGPVNAAQVHNSKITVDNGYDIANGKVHGSRLFNALVPGKRAVSGSFDIWFDDDGDYQNFWGSTSDTTPNVEGAFSTVSLVFAWTMDVVAGTGHDYSLTLTIPEAMYESTTVIIGDRIKQTVNWSAQYDDGTGYEVLPVLVNKVVSYP